MNTRFLMCRPEFYGVKYEINPWMNRSVQPEKEKAETQWETLYHILKDDLHCTIEIIPGDPGLPDMVFTANAGFVDEKRFVPSRFRYPQRRGEESHYRKWFEERGYEVVSLPENGFFEGEGDALFHGDTVFAGYRFRSDAKSHIHLGKVLNRRVISLELIHKWFYHLDTCFCPLADGKIMYYPGAFDEYGRKAMEGFAGKEGLIAVDEEEARTFCCNAMSIGDVVVINTSTPGLVKKLESKGLQVIQTDLSEFIKSGGSAKCLALRLN